jgi:hypothetical protein
MRLFTAALLAVPLTASPALATGSIFCEGVGDDVSIEFTIGSLPVLAIVAAQVTAGDEVWATADGGDHQIAVGQAFAERGQLLADFVDTNFERVLVRLRLVSASEGDDEIRAGTLVIVDRGAWPVVCVGP